METNKNSTKFNYKDWVCIGDTGRYGRVCETSDDKIVLNCCNFKKFANNQYVVPADEIKDLRLWTLADAKLGDYIRGGDDSDIVVIFKSHTDKLTSGSVYAFAGIDASGYLQITDNVYECGWILDETKASPASPGDKRMLDDLLMESGFEFEPKIKKLTKLPSYKEGDYIEYNGDVYKIVGIAHNEISGAYSYDVSRIAGNFPEELPKSNISVNAESRMKLICHSDGNEITIPIDETCDKVFEIYNKHQNTRDFPIDAIVREFREWLRDVAIKNRQIDGNNKNLQS